MGVESLLFLLALIIVVAIIAFICWWLIGQVGFPQPIDMACKALIVIVAVIIILRKSGLLAGF